jgi:hypothetical protein
MEQPVMLIVEHNLSKEEFEGLIGAVILLMIQRGCVKVDAGPFAVTEKEFEDAIRSSNAQI